MGGTDVAEGAAILREAGIPTFAYPDTACACSTTCGATPTTSARCTRRRRCRSRRSAASSARRSTGSSTTVAAEGRTLLTEDESKAVLAAYGIPITDTRLAHDGRRGGRRRRRDRLPGRGQAAQPHDHPQDGRRRRAASTCGRRRRARRVRGDPRLGHGEGRRRALRGRDRPADDQLVRLRADRRRSPDPQFGPVLLFGMGGQLVEVFRDRALALPPLKTTLARRMIERTTIATALRGVRGRRPVDIDALGRCWCGSASSSPSSGGSPRSTSTRCSPRPSGSSRSTRGSCSTRRTSWTRDLPRLAIRPYPHAYIREIRDGPGRRSSSGRSARRTSR